MEYKTLNKTKLYPMIKCVKMMPEKNNRVKHKIQ